MFVAVRVAECEGIIVERGLGKVQRAGCGVVTVVRVQEPNHIRNLQWQIKSAKPKRHTHEIESETHVEHNIAEEEHMIKSRPVLG